jgi:CMP-N-acetylneuraminic acid synthetase
LDKHILVIIPARGNSKGIPRKNLRALNGKPLIYYSITNALSSSYQPDVFVSSDDEEIINIALKVGAKIINRDSQLAQDATTLDPVIYDGYLQAKEKTQKAYDLIITLQPTSPLLQTASLDAAIARMLDKPEIDTILSAIEDKHLTWGKNIEDYVPNFSERLNRQYLPDNYKETGGFLITRPSIISENNRIGKKVDLYLLSGEEAIDIDNFVDWNICAYYLKRKRIVFVITGYHEVGLGHAYRGLNVANEILDHEIIFLVDSKSEEAFNLIAKNNYKVYRQEQKELLDDIYKLDPDVIINDKLDTSEAYMQALLDKKYLCINFEDLGEGHSLAHLTINALYQDGVDHGNVVFGSEYVILRQEFELSKTKVLNGMQEVLITFGGIDPNNFTEKVLKSIYPACFDANIKVKIIAGLGYKHYDQLPDLKGVEVLRNVKNISEHMLNADLAFTSGGRTTYELASLGIPTVVICQNERELTHKFAAPENGFLHLGLGTKLSGEDIVNAFSKMTQTELRKDMHHKMLSKKLLQGKQQVIDLIQSKIASFKYE